MEAVVLHRLAVGSKRLAALVVIPASLHPPPASNTLPLANNAAFGAHNPPAVLGGAFGMTFCVGLQVWVEASNTSAVLIQFPGLKLVLPPATSTRVAPLTTTLVVRPTMTGPRRGWS